MARKLTEEEKLDFKRRLQVPPEPGSEGAAVAGADLDPIQASGSAFSAWFSVIFPPPGEDT